MNTNSFALGKKNFIIIGIALFMVFIGFIMMCGSSSDMQTFDPDIFSFRRIVAAPNICLAGYVLMIVGILYRDKNRKPEASETQE